MKVNFYKLDGLSVDEARASKEPLREDLLVMDDSYLGMFLTKADSWIYNQKLKKHNAIYNTNYKFVKAF